MALPASAGSGTNRASPNGRGAENVTAAATPLADALAQVEDLEARLEQTTYRDAGCDPAATETHLRLFADSLRENGEALLRAADAVNHVLDGLCRVAGEGEADGRRPATGR